MENIRSLLKVASQRYNKSLPHLDSCRELVRASHGKLSGESKYESYGAFVGRPSVPYYVFSLGSGVTRPIRPDIYVASHQTFLDSYDAFIQSLNAGSAEWSEADINLANQMVYTAVMSVACCYDLWQRGSRKTPATFFEILMAALLQQMLPS